MPVWLSGGIGPIAADVLSQCSVEPEARETAWMYAPGQDVPDVAYFAGENEKSEEIFIGRTVLDGDLVPGMIVPEAGLSLFANKGKVSHSDDKQVLCGMHMKWTTRLPDMINPRAVMGGRLANGEPVYIGKAELGSKVLIGRVDPTQDRQLFLPVDDKEVAVSDYQILIEGV